MKQYKDISLKDFHTFHTNEKAELLSILESKEDAIHYFNNSNSNRLQVIGEGSNLLFKEDFKGEIIKLINRGIEIIEEKGKWVWIKVAAGENWDDLVKWTVDKGFGGIENLSYIPGTVGAAPVQNIGAYGVELKDVFQSLEAIHLETGRLRNFYLHELEFDYRYSVFKGPLKNQFLILNVVFKLARYPQINLDYGNLKEEVYRITNKNIPDISEVRQAVINIRKSKLPEPDEIGNAGSFFKNPVIDQNHFNQLKEKHPLIPSYPLQDGFIKIAAAWLIQQCGFKGVSKGDTGTHENHALIIVNRGKATGMQIKKFSDEIQQEVFKKYQITLEPEVLIL